jgi:hypothetical protein
MRNDLLLLVSIIHSQLARPCGVWWRMSSALLHLHVA